MRIALACTALLAFACAPVRASVVYEFVTTWRSPFLKEQIGPGGSLPLKITVSDAVYLRKSVRLRREGCHGGAPWECDRSGPWDQVAIESTSPLWGGGTVGLTFLPDGTLAGGIVEDGMDMNLTLTGSGFDWASSRFGGDFIKECRIGAVPEKECAFTGYFVSTGPFPVPEPIGAAVLVTGGLGLALTRRRGPG